VNSIRSTILLEFKKVAAEQKKKLPPLDDDLILLDTGLDSLCFAIIVARLADELGSDPFSAKKLVHFPVTLGNFIRLYEHGVH